MADETGKNYLRANIDRAIVLTQFDLRGFLHPLGFRQKFMSSPKSLDATTCNLLAVAAGLGANSQPTDTQFKHYGLGSYEETLAMCKRLAADCDCFQKEALQIILQEIVRQNKQMRTEVAGGMREASGYLHPLNQNSAWGKTVLALSEAFGFVIEPEAGAEELVSVPPMVLH